jgi:uncharacterized membrane protein required for colicin V production
MPYSHLAQRSPHASKTRSFLVGLGQMILMSSNIRNIANGYVVFGSALSFVNTYVWLYVVRSAIHATKAEKFFYATGSAFGVALGIVVSHYLIEPHAVTHLSEFFGL